MSLEISSCEKAQNENKMCGLLKNLAQQVLNDQPDGGTKSSTETAHPNSVDEKDSTVSGLNNSLKSNGDIISKHILKLIKDKDGKNSEKQVENHENMDKDVDGVSDPQKNVKSDAKEASSSEEIETIQRWTDLLTQVSSDKSSYRPMAEVLINIGTDAAMLHVCKDLIGMFGNSQNPKLNISKAKETERRLSERFKPYFIRTRSCRCGRKCYSNAELQNHKRMGWSTNAGWFKCCFCNSFRTRLATHFVDHLCDDHGVRGTTEPSLKNMCNYCPYENRDWRRTMMHEEKCKGRFVLSRNLVLINNDIMIFFKPNHYLYYGQPRTLPSKSPSSGYAYQSSLLHNKYSPLNQTSTIRSHVRPTFVNNTTPRLAHPKSNLLKDVNKPNSLDMKQIQEVAMAVMAQMNINYPTGSGSGSQLQDLKMKSLPNSGGPSCEICSASVVTLELLLKHMQQVHQINIKSIDFFLRGKGFVCKTCFQGFWTQLGLNRHQQQVHSINRQNYPCFICGPITSTDILTHLMTKHNISLQDMLVFGWCYICKAETKTPERFVDHMISVHSDLFPSRTALESMVVLFKGLKNSEGSKSESAFASWKPTTSKGKAIGSHVSFGRAKHRCNSCQMRFEDEAELETHYRIFHTVSCTRCNEKWTSVEAMLKHFGQSHYNEKDPCTICKEQVKIGVPMIRHMKRMHLKKCVVMLKRLSPSERMKYLQMSRRSSVSNSNHGNQEERPLVAVEDCPILL